MQTALDLEKCINQVLLELHKLAIEQKDPHVSTISGFIGPQQTCTQTNISLDLI